MRHFTILFAIPIVLVLGCSHSSTAPEAGGGSTPMGTYYSIVGSVLEVSPDASGYDAVDWTAATDDSINISGPKTFKAYTGLSGTFFFDSLTAGSYTITAAFNGYVPASLHILEPDTVSSQNVIHIYPESWIQATIDSVGADSDVSLGEDVWVSLKSMNPAEPSLGTVYLYLSKQRSIDPNNPSSYDYVYEQIGNEPDSALKLNVLPGVQQSYPAGTPVFCTAYASPYQGKYVFGSYDSTGKIIYPFFGQYPTNTVQFYIP